jgi:predicted NACHT family NTPase
MAERSLRATPEGIKKAKKACKDQGWTQTQIGEQIGTTRQPVGKFFAGKPIERPNFIDICRLLDLSWEDIAEPEPVEQNQKNSIDINALVQEVREKVKPTIEERCGTMRVLDMSQPIGLNDIYTNVNILEKITGRRRKEIAQLLQECTSENFERFELGRITDKRVPGLDAVERYTKLIILGKPGAGKTTFLKYLAIQCNRGEFQAEHVPIFVTLKDFAEAPKQPRLLEYISQQFSDRDIVETQSCSLHSFTSTSLHGVLNQGKALILLDGLDEVREDDSPRVLTEIHNFFTHFCENQFVLTCRIAAQEYIFEKFTEVELSDFDNKQISTFATNWFKGKAVKAETFIKRLQDNSRIKELATNPLLLTLLCLVFEESGDFPANRSELYKEGLDALLKKWDAKRGIYRDQVYKKLSVQRKEDLLSKIALTTFERGDYFFKQKVAEQYITHYIRNLPNANTDPEALQLDSEVILHSIEAQHGLLVERAKGIYSFSHLTFHEYFTAREFVVVKQSAEEALQNLVSHIIEKRWREVFLLAVGMSPSADCLLQLMKEKVDVLVADEKLQQFLMWVSQKSFSVKVPYKPAAVRDVYFVFFSFDYEICKKPDFLYNYLDPRVKRALQHLEFVFDPWFGALSHGNSELDLDLSLGHILCIDDSVSLIRPVRNVAYSLRKFELEQSLEQLHYQLPSPFTSWTEIKSWQQSKSKQAWTEQLRDVMIEHRNIGHDWQFSTEQKKLLNQYYDANLFLVECLNSDCYVSREVRQEIEDTLLLPIAEIEKRKNRE